MRKIAACLVLLAICGCSHRPAHPTSRATFEAYIHWAVKHGDADAIVALDYPASTPDQAKVIAASLESAKEIINFKKVQLSWRPVPKHDLQTWRGAGEIPMPEPTAYLCIKNVGNPKADSSRFDYAVGKEHGKMYFPVGMPDPTAKGKISLRYKIAAWNCTAELFVDGKSIDDTDPQHPKTWNLFLLSPGKHTLRFVTSHQKTHGLQDVYVRVERYEGNQKPVLLIDRSGKGAQKFVDVTKTFTVNKESQ